MMRQWRNAEPNVLNYETPPPPMTWWEQVVWWISNYVDPLGGIGWAMFELSLIVMALGLLIAPLALPCFVVAAGIWWWLIHRWSKTSRWF
jgi:hypothetical protein